MIGIKLNYPAAGIDSRLALAETAIQPSGTAPAGQVPMADGSGGITWTDPLPISFNEALKQYAALAYGAL